MSFYELQDRYFRLHAERSFAVADTHLYFYLLHQFNAARWPEKLFRKRNEVAAGAGIDVKTLDTARTRLAARGLLAYEPGDKVKSAVWALAYGTLLEGKISLQSEDCSRMEGKISPTSGNNTPDSSRMEGKISPLYKEEEKTTTKEEEKTLPPSAAVAAVAGSKKNKGEEIFSAPAASPTAATEKPPVAATPQRPTKPAKAAEPEHFPAFWAAWPKKEGRLDALRAFAKLPADDQTAAASRADTWLAGRPDLADPARYQFIPHASTWLNKQRWTDAAPALASAGQPTPRPARPAPASQVSSRNAAIEEARALRQTRQTA